MSVYEPIRKTHDREGQGIRALSRRFSVHHRVVRQALASAVRPPRKARARRAPKMDCWKPIIEKWLEEDKTSPCKQRHTAWSVWQRLVEEHRAEASEGTVRRFVAVVKARQQLLLAKVAVPQTHPFEDEAEVDFGTVSVTWLAW